MATGDHPPAPPSCELVLGGRHARAVLAAADGLRTAAVAAALAFTPTQAAHLHLVGLEPLLGQPPPPPSSRPAQDAPTLIPFVYGDDDDDDGMISGDAVEAGAVYRVVVQDRRAALVAALGAGQRDAFVAEFHAMGAVAGILSPAVAVEYFSRRAARYLAAAAAAFADDADLARAVRRTVRETLAAQMGAVLDQDVGQLGTITLDNFLAYKAAAAAAAATAPSPRPSLNAAAQSLQQRLVLARGRHPAPAAAAWDPSTDAIRSGLLEVRPVQKGSVVEIVTDAGARGKDAPVDVDDDDDDDDTDDAGDDDEDDVKAAAAAAVRQPSLGRAASAIIDGVRHQFVLHSSSGQAIHTVWMNVARRQVVLASRGLLTTRKTVIRFGDIRRCDDGAARDANCFSIVTGRRDYHLETATARERDVWVAALNEVAGFDDKAAAKDS